jgi:DNA-binding response OmpR family regulator
MEADEGLSMKLLVADSDVDMVEMLTSWLRTRGYEVKYALSAERIRSTWIEQQPDLVIVDTGLRSIDALGLCRELRGAHDALILAVASSADADSQVRCLESGADACLVKPYLPVQLLAHIHALSRRVRSTLLRHPSSIVSVGPIRVDTHRNEVSVHGKVVRLTPTESKLLHLLAVNANDVCTLDQIVAHVWGYGDEADTTLIKAHIRHLREKIERNPSKPCYIVTVAGSGYMFVRQPDQRVSDPTTEATAGATRLVRLGESREVVRQAHLQHASPNSRQAAPEYLRQPTMDDSIDAGARGGHDAGIYIPAGAMWQTIQKEGGS